MKTKSNILNKEFDFKVHHVALIVSDDLWLNDKWMVIINGQTFDYHTGIGHREPLNEWWGQEFNRLMSLNPKKRQSKPNHVRKQIGSGKQTKAFKYR